MDQTAYAQQPDLRAHTDKVSAPGIVQQEPLTMSMVLELLDVTIEHTGQIASNLHDALDPLVLPNGVLFDPPQESILPNEAPAAAPIVLAISDKVSRLASTNRRLEVLLASLAL